MRKTKNEDGQGLVEYALVLVLVAVVVMVVLSMVGDKVVLAYAQVMGGFNGDTLDDGVIMLSGDISVVDAGGCTATIQNVRFIVVDSDRNALKNQSVSATIVKNTVPTGQTISGTANGSGIATYAGPQTVNGSCPLNITLSN